MLQRKSHVFLLFVCVNLMLSIIMFLHASIRQRMDQELLAQKSEVVRYLGLTDICMFTDARYTRHPSLADLHTPFQDYPLSLEHFPSGSVVPPPPHFNHSLKR